MVIKTTLTLFINFCRVKEIIIMGIEASLPPYIEISKIPTQGYKGIDGRTFVQNVEEISKIQELIGIPDQGNPGSKLFRHN